MRRASSGKYSSAGSSSDSLPASLNCRMAIAVKLFVIEAIRKTLSSRTGSSSSRSRTPVTAICSIRPSTIIAHAAPGTCSRATKSLINSSICGKVIVSWARRSACSKRAGGAKTGEAATGIAALIPNTMRADRPHWRTEIILSPAQRSPAMASPAMASPATG